MAKSTLYQSNVKPVVAHEGASVKTAHGTIIFGAIIATLYIGKAIFVPLAIAILLAFVLTPIIRILRRAYVPRPAAVLFTVAMTALIVAGVSVYIGAQLQSIGSDLPRYERTFTSKIEAIKKIGSENSWLGKLTKEVSELQEKFETKTSKGGDSVPSTRQTAGHLDAPSASPQRPETRVDKQKPAEVIIREPPQSVVSALKSVASAILAPLAMLGAVFLFLTFILMQREDMRDRAIRLFGSGDIERTTAAMNDGAGRLSRLLLAQTILNAIFGIAIGTGLWFLGIPAYFLWGVLAFLMRFVPFIGSFIAAGPPLALAFAIDPGWSLFFYTLAIFAIGEPLMGHVVEPLVQGHTTGLSPLAVVLSAAFWTLLWGPMGLLLAVPLTVCLVVLGRHVEKLEYLDVLLGDQPALTPAESFYQRALAGDSDEACDQAESHLKNMSLLTYYDDVARPGLVMAQADAELGYLDKERQLRVLKVVSELVEDLEDLEDVTPGQAKASQVPQDSDKTKNAVVGKINPKLRADSAPNPETDIAVLTDNGTEQGWQSPCAVLCVAAGTHVDIAAAHILVHLLYAHGIDSRALSRDQISTPSELQGAMSDVQHICIVSLNSATNNNKFRFLARRIRRHYPGRPISILLLGHENEPVDLIGAAESLNANRAATRFRDAVGEIVAEAIASGCSPSLPDVTSREA